MSLECPFLIALPVFSNVCFKHYIFYCTKPGKWAVIYFYCIKPGKWAVIYFLLDFGTVPTMWYIFAFHFILSTIMWL
jgi:hypothetical protein